VAIVATSGFFVPCTMCRRRFHTGSRPATFAEDEMMSDAVSLRCFATTRVSLTTRRARPTENHAHSGRRASMTHRSRLQVFKLKNGHDFIF
jgi:hypothetical protein